MAEIHLAKKTQSHICKIVSYSAIVLNLIKGVGIYTPSDMQEWKSANLTLSVVDKYALNNKVRNIWRFQCFFQDFDILMPGKRQNRRRYEN